MENIVRHVGSLNSTDRQAIEHLIGQALGENQQLVIQVVTPSPSASPARSETGIGTATLPTWCNVYAGLSDNDVADLENIILARADLARPVQ